MALLVSLAVEGALDEAVLGRLLRDAGAEVGPVYGKRGKDYLRRRVSGFNHAERHAPWLVLTDLDQDPACAAELVRSWLPVPATHMCLRVAVRAVESWSSPIPHGWRPSWGCPRTLFRALRSSSSNRRGAWSSSRRAPDA